MIVTWLRNGSSGLRLVGARSKVRPTCAGTHRLFLAPNGDAPAAPWTISMATSRRAGVATAVLVHAVLAGSIASSIGKPIVAPIAFKTVRRGIDFLVMNALMTYLADPLVALIARFCV